MTTQLDLLALVKRHIVEGEIRVTHLVILIGRLQIQGHDTALAERMLTAFDQALTGMYEYLRFLQAKQDLL